MKLSFTLSRVAIVAILFAIPLFIWPPPTWLIVLCWTAAGLTYRFGMYHPDTRLQRLIVSLSLGCLALAALPGTVTIPPELIANPEIRNAINAVLSLILRTTTNPLLVLLLGIVFVSVCALEAWQIYIRERNHCEVLQITPISGQSIVKYSYDEECYIVEQRVVITNKSSAPIEIQAASISAFGNISLKTDIYISGEVILPLSPGYNIRIVENGTREIHVMAKIDSKFLRLILAFLDSPGLCSIPLPFTLKVRDTRLPFKAFLNPRGKSFL